MAIGECSAYSSLQAGSKFKIVDWHTVWRQAGADRLSLRGPKVNSRIWLLDIRDSTTCTNIVLCIIIIFVFYFFAHQHKACRPRKLSNLTAATIFHSVIIVFWKATAFPCWRAMESS